ncbi:MAG: GTP 3',8-cyclase MoaA [Alcanivorax sp.]|nr:GTP 3',8-cyclase MoaA [Alcanivorax sp.]
MTQPVQQRELIDGFNRRVDYVRLSVTDRCDFRCVYCMAEEMTFLPRADILSLEELHRVARVFVSLGVTRIRLTGGEPLVRPGIEKLAAWIAAEPGLEELTLTTNAGRLASKATALRAAGVKRLNISLDSLDETRFRALTRTGNLADVLAGIQAAREAGFERIRLNSVIMRGRNDDEVLALTAFALENGLDIAFIEEMPLGAIDDHNRAEMFVSSEELRDTLAQRYTLLPATDGTAGPSRYWRVAGESGRIGFISPHSHNFCHLCNRVRVTVEGRLLLCLGNEHSVDLKPLLREHPEDDAPLAQAIIAAMDIKPERHHFSHDDNAEQLVRFMNMTGG